MRVLWISDFRPLNPSGATSQAILCGKGLKDTGVDVIFCQTPPLNIRGEKYIESETEGVRLLYPIKNTIDTVRDVDPDVILIQCYTEHLLAELGNITREYPTALRVGINIHELILTPGYSKTIPKVIMFMRSVDHLIAASENTKNVLEGLGCRGEDISVIHTAVDLSRFQISSCTDPTIAVLGRVFPVKNHLTLIEAVKLVRKDFPHIELAIVGEGRLVKIYQDLINQLLLASQVKITGYMSDLNWLFREVSIFALPSFSENMPMAVLEAYASGIPCIISDSGWGNTFKVAMKAKPDNPREWADCILRLLTDRELYMEIRNRQLEEVKDFTIDKIVSKYISLFERLTELKKYKVKKFSPRRIEKLK